MSSDTVTDENLNSENLNDETDRVTDDSVTEAYHGRYDWESADPICLTVVEAVSAIIGREPGAMEPLYSVLDPDALEALLSSGREGRVRLSFSYEGCTVTLTSDGEMAVRSER